MQMQNSTPQGIAGLMQKPQGQPPMPSPAKASPMAGLGGVDDRVSAYMGNTKPLEQRYAMSQDLLDLLALQKIKSQKDAAARQMQMQMAQQQAQNGEAGMTVAQQREKEVTDLTKNELAQQRGETAQQQNAEQQAAMQKMMGGVASAPGAAMAAQPQAMAAGGIVGYAGPQGSVVSGSPDDEKSSPAGRFFRGLMQSGRTQGADDQERGRLRNAIIEKFGPKSGVGGVFAQQSDTQRAQAQQIMSRLDSMPIEEMRQVLAGGAPTPAAPPQAPPAVAPVPQAAPPQAPPVAPKPPVQPGLPSLPGAAGNPAAAAQVQPGVVGPANDFGTKLEAAALKDAELDVQKAKLDEEIRVQNKLALTPEQRGVYNEGISGLQKMYQEQYDPERQRQEGLKRFLIGAGGRRYGELGGGAASAMDYDAAQRADKLGEFKGIQSARTGLIDIDRANVKEGIGAGQKAYEQTSATKRTGLDAGRSLYNTDVSSRDNRYSTDVGSRDKLLDRDIEKRKIQAQAAATEAMREGTTFNQQQTLLNSTIRNRSLVVEAAKKRYASKLDMVEMSLAAKPTDPALLKQRNDLQIKLDAEIDDEVKLFDESIARIESAMTGKGGTAGYTVKKKSTP